MLNLSSFGKKLQKIDKTFSPSPGTYTVTNFNVGSSGEKWAIGTEARKGLTKNTLSPGPGAYTVKSAAFELERPRFFMGEKIRYNRDNKKVPGPGNYNPNCDPAYKTGPKWSMKSKLGSSLDSRAAFVPGPGNYNPSFTTRRQAPQFGFGSSTRDGAKGKKLDVPGPGAYRVKSYISDVPDYAMPNRKQESKYV